MFFVDTTQACYVCHNKVFFYVRYFNIYTYNTCLVYYNVQKLQKRIVTVLRLVSRYCVEIGDAVFCSGILISLSCSIECFYFFMVLIGWIL